MPDSRPPAAATVSIIIPTYNEAAQIGALVTYLRAHGAAEASVELLVADAQSPDGTAGVAAAAGARVLQCPRKGRAAQLNHGARHASGQLLYFLHADTLPPANFLTYIRQALADEATGSGCFRLCFDYPHWFLRLSAWFTRFDLDLVRFGDQSLFVRAEVFWRAGGFQEELLVLEDQEIIGRLRRHGRFRLLPFAVTTSARKYRENGVFRLQFTFGLLCALYYLRVPQPAMVRTYRHLIRQDKL
ncbi:TIGR04283 family arsenosugar biosynthesis glycosyltransferase [Hymenobacter sp. J193]|uniref:TIGR04283 family arsenosugar biosynthesis glycosyltransferase n=1 Tax=Hymenobacter sp. J193 TaxID=2898429 RepID=UPI002151BF7D|nr:TIGR04283 family arsenosugar biosynthesis glycosyltransferase [Hymenobacter sp. J193]MCR5886763.1 TIGR04283 family arsenosugar biosynthesis glycosyltransferase [Hymenobacter sp. J193]